MAPVGAAPVEAAILLATIDPYGWAHPALVSYAEVLALDASRLRASGGGDRGGEGDREAWLTPYVLVAGFRAKARRQRP